MEKQQVEYDAEKYPNFKEYLWFKEHEAELMQRFYGRYLIIKGQEVLGDYGSWRLAWSQAVNRFHLEPDTFIIHLCEKRDPRRAPRLVGRKLISVNGD
jgi:hypothetical protein